MGYSMLRRILATLTVALAGLLVIGGTASADTDYGPDSAVGLSSSLTTATPGQAFDLIGDGFDAGETVDVVGSVSDTAPALRSAHAFALRSSPLEFQPTADANGHFVIEGLSYDEAGFYTFVATGQSSNKSASQTVEVSVSGISSTT